MRRWGVSSERRRSSCSSLNLYFHAGNYAPSFLMPLFITRPTKNPTLYGIIIKNSQYAQAYYCHINLLSVFPNSQAFDGLWFYLA